MGYEIFTKDIVRTGSPRITLNTFGRVGINQIGTKLLQDNAVEFVLLLWDKNTNKIALRRISKKDKRAYTISFAKRGNGAGFSAKTFFMHIGYDFSKTRSYHAEWNESEVMLEIDLEVEAVKSRQQDVEIAPKPAMSAVR